MLVRSALWGKDRNAVPIPEAARQLGWVNYVQRHILRVVQVDGLVEHHHVAGCSRARGVGWIEERAVVAHVVEKSGRDRRAPRDERQQAGKRV